MEKFRIKKLEGTIAYVTGLKMEQINTSDFIIFKIDNNIAKEEIMNIIASLKAKGVKKTFIVLPKEIEYCVFEKEDK
jgi:biopolymer transport protein ExbD